MNEYNVFLQDSWEQDDEPSHQFIDANSFDDALANAMAIEFPRRQYKIVSRNQDHASSVSYDLIVDKDLPLTVHVFDYSVL